MNTKLLRAVCISAIGCGLCFVENASAATYSVTPGQTVSIDPFIKFVPPSGTVVSETTKKFTMDFSDDKGLVHIPANGTFLTQVLRRDDGKLTFLYNIEVLTSDGGDIGEEGGSTQYSAFGDFTTIVSGQFQHGGNPGPVISRSSDGNTLSFGGEGHGEPTAQSPLLVVETDATEFDSNGHTSLTWFDETGDPDPLDPGFTTIKGTADFSSVFEPVHESGPVAVPLPPAAYGGLAMLAGIVVTRIRRQKA